MLFFKVFATFFGISEFYIILVTPIFKEHVSVAVSSYQNIAGENWEVLFNRQFVPWRDKSSTQIVIFSYFRFLQNY